MCVIENPELFSAGLLNFKAGSIKNFFVDLHIWALQKIETASNPEIEALQLKRFKKIIRHAYATVPFWREWLDKSHVRPEDITQISDSARIPITGRIIYKQQPIERLCSMTIPKKRFYSITTSGSTGVPFRFFTDILSEERRLAIRMRSIFWTIGDPRKNKRHLKLIRVAKQHHFYPGFTAITAENLEDLKNAVEPLLKICANDDCILIGFSSYIIRLATLLQELKIILPMRGVVASAESIDDGSKQLIRGVFRCGVGERYSSSEAGGTIAQMCSADKYHLNPDQNLVEIANKDPVTGIGKIIITDFNNLAMPIIRYEIGDLGSISPAKCGCGSNFPMIEFKGRDIAIYKMPDGRIIHAFDLQTIVSKNREWVSRFQFVRKKPDEFELLVQPRGARYQVHIENLRNAVNNFLGTPIKVTLIYASEIDVPLGHKFQPFLSFISTDKEI